MPRGENQLCKAGAYSTISARVEFRQQRGGWFVHLLLLMPDHLHRLVSFPRDSALKRTISVWKEMLAKRAGIRWQRDFFDHRLRATESDEEKARYIRMNPVRQGLVLAPEAWGFVWEPK